MPSDDEIRRILQDQSLSSWFCQALASALDRDPVDAVNDAELLAVVLGHRSDCIQAEAQAELTALNVIRRAKAAR